MCNEALYWYGILMENNRFSSHTTAEKTRLLFIISVFTKYAFLFGEKQAIVTNLAWMEGTV